MRDYGATIRVYLPGDMAFIEWDTDLNQRGSGEGFALDYVYGNGWESVYRDLTTSVYRRLA
jgi:hypothetical protein